MKSNVSFISILCLALGFNFQAFAGNKNVAPGAPGDTPVWSFSGKTGIGTSYESYIDGRYGENSETGEVSKVWFSIAKGALTETMWGLIHEAQIKDMQLIAVGPDFVDLETEATVETIDYLSRDENGNPDSLAYRVTTRDIDGDYEIVKDIFTHPSEQALFVRVSQRVLKKDLTGKVKFYVQLNPHIANTGTNDRAELIENGVHAWEEGASGKATHLSLRASQKLKNSSVGFIGRSDGLTQLRNSGELAQLYSSTGPQAGNVSFTAELSELDGPLDIAIGFGHSRELSDKAAAQTLADGYDKVLSGYNASWQVYLDSLSALPALRAVATDGGSLANVSALVLKAQEDKTHAGALIASLSNPWGDTVVADQSSTGYKAVWPRDFYQCAMALLALGDVHTPKVAFEYLKKVQVSDETPGNKGVGGWFLQKTHVDGELEWMAVQLDQTAMPLMLAWKLHQHGVLSDQELAYWYEQMLKPAADFLVTGGQVNLGWNNTKIKPPYTQQERWEEQQGYSPSTTAAVIAGLISAADIAELSGDKKSAKSYLKYAKAYSASLEELMFTKNGEIQNGNGSYYLRITQNRDPNDNGALEVRNGQKHLYESEILDAGFLELVRYGVRAADDSHVLDSLAELDDLRLEHELRVKYEFVDTETGAVYPGWRRYGRDGYGENVNDGSNYGAAGRMSEGQRGRVWPFFTGERGHYELAALLEGNAADEHSIKALRSRYVAGMEFFANKGMMLPEQVWDGVGAATTHEFKPGDGTNSATPLAWTHAEYIKLLRSIGDRQVWDSYPQVLEALAP
jgi:glucoamylase